MFTYPSFEFGTPCRHKMEGGQEAAVRMSRASQRPFEEDPDEEAEEMSVPPPPPNGPPPVSARRIWTTEQMKTTLLLRSRENTPGKQGRLKDSPPASTAVEEEENYGRRFEDEGWDEERSQEDDDMQTSSPATPPPPPPPASRPNNQPTIVDRAMELAVDRLAEVIRARGTDAVLDDTIDTRGLLADISTQVSRLLNDANGSAADSDGDDRDEAEDDSTIGRLHRRGSGSDDSSLRPTPYDVWSKRASNGKTSSVDRKEPAKLSESQWEALVDRLYASLKRHNIQIAATQKAIIAKELASVTFTPRINSRSRSLAADDISIMQRTPLLQAHRTKKLGLERQRLVEKELQEATFRPRINETSRILAAGVGSKLFDSPMERREAAARRAQKEREALEKSQHTFSPVINPRSRELAVRGKALQMAYSPAKAALSPRKVSSDSFQPVINAHSRKIFSESSAEKASKPVFDRLYEEGLEVARKNREQTQSGTPTRSDARHGRRAPAVVQFRPGLEFILETLQKEGR